MKVMGGQYQIALGALLGAACGDAAGAPLEHLGRVPHEHEVEVCCPSHGFSKNNSDNRAY